MKTCVGEGAGGTLREGRGGGTCMQFRMTGGRGFNMFCAGINCEICVF